MGAGKAIGINTAASWATRFAPSGGRGYAIPIDQAWSRHADRGRRLLSTVHIGPTAFLGVELAISADRGEFGQGFGGQSGPGRLHRSGAAIAGVVPGSPAAGAGLGSGDLITSLGGQGVGSATALTSLIGRYRPDDHVQVSWSGPSGGQHTSTVQLATGPAA